MEGVSEMEQVFLYGLIGIGLITILYVLFADAIDGMDEGIHFKSGSRTFLHIYLFAAAGYIIEANRLE